MTKSAITSIFGILCLGNLLAQSIPTDEDFIEYDRRLAAKTKLVIPQAGLIPDEETAKAVAQAIAVPIWGRQTVISELPLMAGLKGNIWTVIGAPPVRGAGGELIIQLDKRTGAVLSILHTQ